eukprot:1961830-Rhodomonas_salina.2
MIPFVLDNFLNNRLEPLEPICTERSIAVLGALIKDRCAPLGRGGERASQRERELSLIHI